MLNLDAGLQVPSEASLNPPPPPKKEALDGEIFMGTLKLMFLGEKLQTHFHFTPEVDEHDDTQQLLTAGRCHLCRASFL